MLSRRRLIQTAAGGGAFLGLTSLIPAWARSADEGNLGIPTLSGTTFDLEIGKFTTRINGRLGNAIGVNGAIPAPLVRFTEGEDITINVKNNLDEDTSIHWHGLLVPFHMDGVPGVSFPGIKPGETFQYRYSVPQNGTYWYHSHSGLQEPMGHYGPMIIDPIAADPVQYDREYVMVLADWTFTNPHRIFAKLKKMSDSLNFQKQTIPDFMEDAKYEGFGRTFRDRARWGRMRMQPTDISDVTGDTYTYLINGRGTEDNWNGIFVPGERVRLRIINASSMSIFNVRIPGLPMTVVGADGLNLRPLEIDEFQIGVAETYDVIIKPEEAKAYAFVAESIDRSGQVVATFGPRPGMRAPAPELREKPLLTMRDMGMDHANMSMDDMDGMDHGKMDHGGEKMSGDAMDMEKMGKMDKMDHGKLDHGEMGHGKMDMKAPIEVVKKAGLKPGPGIINIAEAPVNRLHEPGIGLESVPHRTLTYADLRALEPNTDTREPEREIELHLTANMERYMWSFDGVKFSHVKEPIKFYEGERVRMTLINDTMMPHPIHLHGMFFDLVIPDDASSIPDNKTHKPRKHTVIVKPGEKLSFDVNAEHVGDWAFHCHLLFHMHAGMMQVVSLLPKDQRKMKMDHSKMDHSKMKTEKMDHSKMDHGDMNMKETGK